MWPQGYLDTLLAGEFVDNTSVYDMDKTMAGVGWERIL